MPTPTMYQLCRALIVNMYIEKVSTLSLNFKEQLYTKSAYLKNFGLYATFLNYSTTNFGSLPLIHIPYTHSVTLHCVLDHSK